MVLTSDDWLCSSQVENGVDGNVVVLESMCSDLRADSGCPCKAPNFKHFSTLNMSTVASRSEKKRKGSGKALLWLAPQYVPPQSHVYLSARIRVRTVKVDLENTANQENMHHHSGAIFRAAMQSTDSGFF